MGIVDSPFLTSQFHYLVQLSERIPISADIDVIGLDSMILGAINPQKDPLDVPGGDDEPGHRDIRAEDRCIMELIALWMESNALL